MMKMLTTSPTGRWSLCSDSEITFVIFQFFTMSTENWHDNFKGRSCSQKWLQPISARAMMFFSVKILVILVPQTPKIAGMALVPCSSYLQRHVRSSERWLRDGLGNLPQHYEAIKGACSAERASRIRAVRTNQRGGVEERDLTDGIDW